MIFDSGVDNYNLIAIDIPSETLDYNTTYYWRVRHRDNHGAWSLWSNETSFTTLNRVPDQPINQSPAKGARDISLTPVLQGSDFSDHDTGDIHTASQWQITIIPSEYSYVIYDSGIQDSNITAILVPQGILNGNTTYYWRVRYRDNHGNWSQWSEKTSFTTLNQPPHQPINLSPYDGANSVSLTPTLQASPFSDPDSSDINTTYHWQITTTPGDYSHPVLDSSEDRATSSSFAVETGTLDGNTTYYWRVRYQDDQGAWSPWSIETSFTTTNRPPDQPTNLFPSDGVPDVSLNPILRASLFHDPDTRDSHLNSQWQLTAIAGDYSSPIWDSGVDSHRLTAIGTPPATLLYNTTYYWRVRYQDNQGTWSPWSMETSFTTLSEESWSYTFVDPWNTARFLIDIIEKTFRFYAEGLLILDNYTVREWPS